MTQYQSSFLQEAQQRGFLHTLTDAAALDARFASQSVTVYIGFDCTAPCLHVGSLLQIMLIRLLKKHGHNAIALLGGGTTKIGDPSGKDEARQLLTDEVIAANMAGIGAVLQRLCGDITVVNNADWLDSLNYIAFLRDFGRYFSVNRMLTFDSVRLRLERQQPLSFLEFNYMLLQAYDFLELYQRHGCLVQAGGSDQWGNIVSGVDLVRRCASAEVFGLTTPLLTTAAGHKMGKTAQGAVWLDADKTSAYDYWQYWRNTADADVVRFLRLFTDLPAQAIDQYALLQDEALNEAKIALANANLALVHPTATIDAPPSVSVAANTPLLDALVQSGFAPSRSEARRLVQGGGVRLADAVVTDALLIVTPQHNNALLVVGKKRQATLVVTG